MNAEQPQLFEHGQQKQRIARERMRLEEACLLGRELLAKPAEILADELRLLSPSGVSANVPLRITLS